MIGLSNRDVARVMVWLRKFDKSDVKTLFTGGELELIEKATKGKGGYNLNPMDIWNVRGDSDSIALKVIYKSAIVSELGVDKETANKYYKMWQDAGLEGQQNNFIEQYIDPIILSSRKCANVSTKDYADVLDKSYLKYIMPGFSLGITYGEKIFESVEDVVNDIEFSDKVTDELKRRLSLSACDLFSEITKDFNHASMIEDYANGATFEDLSEKMGVTKARVGGIKKDFENKYQGFIEPIFRELSTDGVLIFKDALENTNKEVRNFIKIHRSLYVGGLECYAISDKVSKTVRKFIEKIISSDTIYIENNELQYPEVANIEDFEEISNEVVNSVVKAYYTPIKNGYYRLSGINTTEFLRSTHLKRCICHRISSNHPIAYGNELIRLFKTEYKDVTGEESDVNWVKTIDYYKRTFEFSEDMTREEVGNLRNKIIDTFNNYKGVYISYSVIYEDIKSDLETFGIDNVDKLKMFIYKNVPEVKAKYSGVGLVDSDGNLDNIRKYIENEIVTKNEPINIKDYSKFSKYIKLYASAGWRKYGLVYLGNGKVTSYKILNLKDSDKILESLDNLFDSMGVIVSLYAMYNTVNVNYPGFLESNHIVNPSEFKKFLKRVLLKDNNKYPRLNYYFG